MALYVKNDIDHQVSESSSAKGQYLSLFAESEVESANYTKHSADKLTVGPSSTVVFNMGVVSTGKALFVKSDQPVELRFNGDGSGPQLGEVAGQNAAVLFTSTSITALSIVNADATNTANVYVSVAGV